MALFRREIKMTIFTGTHFLGGQKHTLGRIFGEKHKKRVIWFATESFGAKRRFKKCAPAKREGNQLKGVSTWLRWSI